MITHLPASDRIAVPWKNGSGVTREVAVFPHGAGLDDFEWRISMAEVTEGGPFSHFTEVHRHLVVLKGILRLHFGARTEVLGPLESVDFAGHAPVFATPLTPVLDLNVMTRTGKASATVRQVGDDVVTNTATAVLVDPVSLDAWRIDGGGQVPVAGILIEFG